MEEFLSQLVELSSSNLILQANVIIVKALLPFDTLYSQGIAEEIKTKIINTLISLLAINNGDLSLQASLKIGNCLSILYSDTRDISNIVNQAIKLPAPSFIYASAKVIYGKHGDYDVDLKEYLNMLLGKSKSAPLSVLYALNVCYKHPNDYYIKEIWNVFKTVEKLAYNQDQTVQLYSIKTIRTLYKTKAIQTKYIHRFVNTMLKYYPSAFCLDKLNNLTVLLVAADISQIGDFNSIFRTMSQGRKDMMPLIRKFLTYFDPSYIHQHCSELLSIIEQYSIPSINELIRVLSFNDRKRLFEDTIKRPINENQFFILKSLAYDIDTTRRTAEIGIEMLASNNKNFINAAIPFFSKLVLTHIDLMHHYLEKAFDFLINTPENQKRVNSRIRAYGYVIAILISSSHNPYKIAKRYNSNINKFLAKALEPVPIRRGPFAAAYIIMSALPKAFVEKKLVSKSLSDFFSFITQASVKSDFIDKDMQINSIVVSMFLQAHPLFPKSVKFLKDLQRKELKSIDVDLATFLAITNAQVDTESLVFFNYRLAPRIQSSEPPIDFTISLLKHKFPSPNILIDDNSNQTTLENNKSIPITYSVTDEAFAITVIRNFSKYVSLLPETEISNWIKWSLNGAIYFFTRHNILFSMLKDYHDTYSFPSNMHELLLYSLKDNESDTQIQLTAECISLYVKHNPQYLQQTLQLISKRTIKTKCLLYASLFSYNDLPQAIIVQLMHEINSLALSGDSSSYALFALYVLYVENPVVLSINSCILDQSNFLMNLIHKQSNLEPITLYCLSKAVRALGPLLSPESEYQCEIFGLILHSFKSSTIIPYTNLIMFKMLPAFYGFVSQLSNILKFAFPRLQNASFASQIAACIAFTNLMKLTNIDADFTHLLPDLLLLLQRTEDSHVGTFIEEIALTFSIKYNKKPMPDQLEQWTNIIRTCLHEKSLPNVEAAKVNVCTLLKKTLLKATNSILPIVLNEEPLNETQLDNIIQGLFTSIYLNNDITVYHSLTPMTMIVKKFPNILEKYHDQFVKVIKIVVPLISYSYKLIRTIIQGIEKWEVNEFFMIILNDIKKNYSKSHGWIPIICDLCLIARSNHTVFDAIEPLLPGFFTYLESKFVLIKDVFTAEKTNWEELSDIRRTYSSFLDVLFSTYIWLKSILKKDLDELNFFLNEFSNSPENWRVDASISALAIISFVYPENIDVLLQKLTNAKESIKQQFIEQTYPMDNSKILDFIISQKVFSANVFIYLLQKHMDKQNQLLEIAFSSDSNTDSLLHLMKEKIPDFVNFVIEKHDIDMARRVIKSAAKNTEIKNIDISFLIEMFSPDLFISLVAFNKDILIECLKSNDVTKIFEGKYETNNEIIKIILFIIVINKLIKTPEDIDLFNQCAAKFGISIIMKYEDLKTNICAVQMLGIIQTCTKRVFERLSSEDKANVCDKLSCHIHNLSK